MNKNLFGNRSIPSFSWHSSHQLTVSTPPPPPTMTHRPSPCLTNISSADGSDGILASSSSYVLISFAIFLISGIFIVLFPSSYHFTSVECAMFYAMFCSFSKAREVVFQLDVYCGLSMLSGVGRNSFGLEKLLKWI